MIVDAHLQSIVLSATLSAAAGCVSLADGPAGGKVPVPASSASRVPQVIEISTTRSFLIRGHQYPAGEAASLRVCVTPEGVISSVEVETSSGEPDFDEFAKTWAMQADVSNWYRKGQREPESCGSVRVEISPAHHDRQRRGADTALG